MTIKASVLAFTNPYSGKKDGGKVDIGNRIKALSLLDTEIDLYSKTKAEEEIKKAPKGQKIRKLYTSLQKNKLSYFFTPLPLSVENKYSEEFKEILKKESYDLTIFEGEHMFKYALNNDVDSKVRFLRMHDIESIYREELSHSTSNKIVSILQHRDSVKYKKVEKKLVKYFHKLLFISKDEMEEFSKLYPEGKEKYAWMPPCVNYKETINYDKAKAKKILYFGDLSVSHNIEGIKWFVEKVYKDLIEQVKDIEIDIIGNAGEELRSFLMQYKNLKVHGYVEDLNSFIDEASLIICPILHGAGVKIKLIEALGMGKIVVATSKAAEGTDLVNGKDVIIADNPKEFAKNCAEIAVNTEKYQYLAENALKKIKSTYSIEAQSRIIKELYEEVGGGENE